MIQTDLNHARQHADVVLLANGEVILIGGGRGTGSQSAEEYQCPLFVPEVFDFYEWEWTALTDEMHQHPRVYHSVTLMLTDGSVWTAGQDKESSCPFICCPEPEWDLADRRAEIYRPFYWFDEDRPEITDVDPPGELGDPLERETTFEVEYSLGQVRTFQWVALIAPSAVTHSVNMTQRYVILDNPNPPVENKVEVEVPPAKYAPPGPYLLVVVDEDNEGRRSASVASWVYLE